MIFSTIRTSLTRSARYRNVINGTNKGRFLWNKDNLGAPTLDKFYGKLELPRGYIAAAGAGKGPNHRTSLSDFTYFAASPRLGRFFSSERPKKNNYENYYPRNRHETPKKDEQKSWSKGLW